MKNLNKIRCGSCALLGGALLALAGSPSAHAGLVAFYDFEGDLVDSSGHGYDASASTNATDISYDTTKPTALTSSTQSLKLSGETSYVSLPFDDSNFNALALVSGASVSLWVNSGGAVNQDYVFSMASDTAFHGFLRLSTVSKAVWAALPPCASMPATTLAVARMFLLRDRPLYSRTIGITW